MVDEEEAAPPIAPQWLLPSTGSVVAATIGAATVLCCAALAPFFIVPWLPRSRFGALPWMPTGPRRVAIALNALPPGLVTTGRFLDLGSGDGTAVILAAQRGMTAVGVELNPTLVWISRMRALAGGVSGTATFKVANLFNEPLSSYECIMVFGVVPLMERIAAKIDAEAPRSCVVISHKFPFSSWADRKIGETEDLYFYSRDPALRAEIASRLRSPALAAPLR